MNKVSVKVGDTIMVSMGYGGKKTMEATVTKVGRVWIETNHLDKFRLDTQTNGSDYGDAPRFWTMEQWAERLKRNEACKFLGEQGIDVRFSGSPWRGREVELAEIIRKAIES